MKKFLLLLCPLLIAGTALYAQTKRIAHRSHSGSDESFSPERGIDNFGLRMDDPRLKKQFDTAAVVADTARKLPAMQQQKDEPRKRAAPQKKRAKVWVSPNP